MPTYVYKFVETGETIEVQQAFSDDALTEYAHPESGEVMAVKKVFLPVGITFKGTGFFKTDNRRAAGSSDRSSGSGSSESSRSGSSESGSKESGPTGSGAKDSGSSGSGSSGSGSASSGSD